MRGCITLQRPTLFGARLHIHWSALVAAGILLGALARQPVQALVAVACYFGVILLHEAGHAYLAKRLGWAPENITIAFLHGVCQYQQPDNLKDEATIAWGGVLAQLAVAIPLIVLSQTTPLGTLPPVAIVVSAFGYFSLTMALMNLAPARGLDGATAWRLIPTLVRERRSKKAAQDVLRRFKRCSRSRATPRSLPPRGNASGRLQRVAPPSPFG